MALVGKPVGSILSQKGFTLEMLLDEDDIVVEAKRGVDEVIGFLKTSSSLKKLISYLVDEPAVGATEAVQKRYPVVAAELLSCEEEALEEALLEHKGFGRLFDFFKAKKVNIQLSNLVVKVLMTLMENQPNKLISHIQGDPTIIQNLVRHLECPVSNLLLKLASGPESVWLANSDLVTCLYKKLSKKNASRHVDVSNLVHDILLSLTWDNPFTQAFASAENSKVLFKYALEEGNFSGLRVGMKTVTLLLRSLQRFMKEEEDEEEPIMPIPDIVAPLKDLPPVVQDVVNNFGKLHEILKKPHDREMRSQDGKVFEACGPNRLCIIEVIEAVVDTGFVNVARKLFESEILDTFWELMFRFDVNTFCHRAVDRVTQASMELVGGITQVSFMQRIDLPTKLIQAEASHGSSSCKGHASHPRIPYLHQTARFIQLVGETNEQVTTYLAGIPGWPEYEVVLNEEKALYEELVSAKNLGTDEEANTFKPGQHYGDFDFESEAYLEGKDGDADDLSLEDDADMDDMTDFDDYDIDQAEIILNKQEVEAFA
eukprot:TRINITY_DN13190_c0_g1_i1.p1 TRINITY_DN13190_c0_g1~~TRINITY_DN13190_c0_g1_i1.p1  ORF type:complete len:542 (-),score=122.83 TRINITY_DN13190_c0_g1_i1:81-1706(-)